MLYAVYSTMRHKPEQPDWEERDIFAGAAVQGDASLTPGIFFIVSKSFCVSWTAPPVPGPAIWPRG